MKLWYRVFCFSCIFEIVTSINVVLPENRSCPLRGNTLWLWIRDKRIGSQFFMGDESAGFFVTHSCASFHHGHAYLLRLVTVIDCWFGLRRLFCLHTIRPLTLCATLGEPILVFSCCSQVLPWQRSLVIVHIVLNRQLMEGSQNHYCQLLTYIAISCCSSDLSTLHTEPVAILSLLVAWHRWRDGHGVGTT